MLNLHETRITTAQFRFFIHLFLFCRALFCFHYIIEFFFLLWFAKQMSINFSPRYFQFSVDIIFFFLYYIMLRNYLIDFRTKHYYSMAVYALYFTRYSQCIKHEDLFCLKMLLCMNILKHFQSQHFIFFLSNFFHSLFFLFEIAQFFLCIEIKIGNNIRFQQISTTNHCFKQFCFMFRRYKVVCIVVFSIQTKIKKLTIIIFLKKKIACSVIEILSLTLQIFVDLNSIRYVSFHRYAIFRIMYDLTLHIVFITIFTHNPLVHIIFFSNEFSFDFDANFLSIDRFV